MDRMSFSLSVLDSISLPLACHLLHTTHSWMKIQGNSKMLECSQGDAPCVCVVLSCRPCLKPSLRKATCDQPSTTGYNFGSAAGTTTIDGFAPTGVACANGYAGTVTYTKCASAGSVYSVSGCKALPSNYICALLGASRPFKAIVLRRLQWK